MPRDRPIDGPALIQSKIDQETTVSQEITLLGQQGSKVTYGNMLLVPVEKSLLWIRPLYVEAAGKTPLPQLKRVIVVYGEKVVMRETLRDALIGIFNSSPPTLEEGGSAATSPTPGATTPTPAPTAGQPTLAQLLAEADAHFNTAQAALRGGDLATYQKENDAARDSIRRATALANATPAPTTTTPPTTWVVS